MKRRKLLIVGLIGVLMVLGMIYLGCELQHDKCDGDCIYINDGLNDKNACTSLDSIGAAKCSEDCAAYKAQESPYYSDPNTKISCNCD